MPSISVLPPTSFGQWQGTFGHSYLFAAEETRLELQDRLNVSALGVVALRGDVMSSGTDTLRIKDVGNIGFSVGFTPLASETDTVADTPLTLGFETVTVGDFGLSQSETYKSQILANDELLTLDGLKRFIPDSWERTYRDQVAITGSGIVTAVGTAATTLSVDDLLDLTTAYRTNLGNRGIPSGMLDGTQLDQVLRSFRTEPAFTNSVVDFSTLLQVTEGLTGVPDQLVINLGGLRLNFGITDSIVQSGGARQGFAFPPGGIGWAVASTVPVRPANPNGFITVPQFGLIIEELTGGGAQTTRRYRATTFFGTALGSTRVFTLRRVISII